MSLKPGIRNSKRFFAVALLALASWPLAARAQAPEAPKPATPPTAGNEQAVASGTVIRTESRIVLVDAVVTDKRGKYVPDLTQQDFKVFEDNKEQAISSFSFGSDPTVQVKGQQHYMILFFDNSSMQMPDQIQARGAAAKFIETSAGPDRLMAVVEFGGSLVIKQNFTANAKLLQAAVSRAHAPDIETNPQSDSQSLIVASTGMPSVIKAEADFGARNMLLGIRDLAKNLRAVPGRKMLILFSAGFPLDLERMSDLTATIDACNKANVAVYSVDVRGLIAAAPGGSARLQQPSGKRSAHAAAPQDGNRAIRPRLVMTSYSLAPALDPQKPGGGGGGTGGGGTGGGGTGGGGTGGGGRGGGTGGGTGGGKGGGTGGGTGGGSGGGTGGGGKSGGTGGTSGAGGTVGNPYANYNNPMNQPQILVPKMPEGGQTNQQVLLALAEGTGGFTIYNTNDLLGGLDRIAQEANQFYVLGYVPQATPEGSCHTLKVKLNRGGMEVRSRSGYCNTRPVNPLDGKPLEKQMEDRAAGSQPGAIHGTMQAPYFYTAPNIARVNLAMQIPGDSLVFSKDKGKYHAVVNVLGIAYKPDGSTGARFNDVLNLDLEKDQWKEFTKEPYRYQNQFELAPGNYKFTVVLSSGGDAFGKFETPLQIDAYDGKKFTLGGVVLSTFLQPLTAVSTEVDAALLEDRTPLIVKGMQVNPAADYRFKKTDNVVLYSEIYEPLLKSENPPVVGAGYRIIDQTTNKEVFSTGAMTMEDFIHKGNPVIPFGMKVALKDLPAGNYRLVLQAVDAANNQAPPRETEFVLSD
jgi:VWFA-related protein